MKSKPHYSQLDYQDRQTIAISLEQGLGIRAIGRVLNRSASTISREIARNSGGHRLQLPLCPATPGATTPVCHARAQAGGRQSPV